FVSQLQRLRVIEAQIQFLLQRVRVLVPAHTHVAGKQRRGAFHDVDVHYAGAQVQKRHHLPRSRLIVVLVAVLQGEGIDVHNSRRLARHREYVGVVQDLVLLDGDQQNIHLRIAGVFGKNLIVEVYIGQI